MSVPRNWLRLPAPSTVQQQLLFRTWTDITGQHKTVAAFVSVNEGQVTLQLRDGQQVTLPVDRLSATDQAYIRRRMSSR